MYNVNQIKKALETNIGKRIMLRAVKGRKRYQITSCTIEHTYPGIFVVKTTDEVTGREKLISFSYSDILTGTIELKMYKDNSKGKEVS